MMKNKQFKFGRHNNADVNINVEEKADLDALCEVVKDYAAKQNWEECLRIIPKYMELYPDSAVPHNLMGIVLEMEGRHPDAMRHFRAAFALDATYYPANYNMNMYGEYSRERDKAPAFSRADCSVAVG